MASGEMSSPDVATQQIRESTRAAVERYRESHPAQPGSHPLDTSGPGSVSSSGTIAPNHDEHDEPSSAAFTKAGMVATGAGMGGAAKRYLASSGGREPVGWQGVDVPSKHTVWSRGIKKERTKALKVLAGILIFLALWMWACLSLFWGSTYHLQTNFHRLTVHLVPLDTSANSFLVGPMIEMANTQNSLPTPHFTYIIRQASDYPNGLADVEREVLGQECWAAVVINANATSAWEEAIRGDTGYSPNGAIGIYFQSARFYQVVLLYIQQTITMNLMTPLSSARASALQSFASSASTNAGLITSASAVPSAIGVGFGYTIHDLRSIGNGEWGASAPMEAALIYFVIFAFYWTLFQAQGRMKSGLQTKLKFSSMLVMRLVLPIVAYFFLSLWFTCVEAIWQVPLQNHLGRGGFPALWALNWVTIVAAGLAMETIQALVGIAGLPLFLILWIILNISSSFYPIEMMPTFYRFLYWMPFINNVEAYKIITFGTNFNHRLGKHFGILFGIVGVELIVYPLCIWFERWRGDRGMIKAQREKREAGEE